MIYINDLMMNRKYCKNDNYNNDIDRLYKKI